jgi:pimeloyl-ACP methyl ester carboxylesterase
MLDSRFVDTAGLRLRYIECGSGDPPIVFVHGLGE